VLRPGELAGLAKRPTAGVWHEDQPDLGVPITLNGIRGVIDPALLNGTFALKPLIRFRSGLKATLLRWWLRSPIWRCPLPNSAPSIWTRSSWSRAKLKIL